MQSLLTDSFNNKKEQKTVVKSLNKPVDDDEREEDSKRE